MKKINPNKASDIYKIKPAIVKDLLLYSYASHIYILYPARFAKPLHGLMLCV